MPVYETSQDCWEEDKERTDYAYLYYHSWSSSDLTIEDSLELWDYWCSDEEVLDN